VEEKPQTAERRETETDKLARVPALAIGYRMPPARSPDALAGAVTGELLHNGQASLLYQALVKDKKVALSVNGGLNWPLGNPFEYNGPTLMTSFIVYPPNVTEDQVLAAYDATVKDLAAKGPSQEELDRIVAKMRADLYAQLEIPINRASALSHAVLFTGSFDSVFTTPNDLAKVTPDQVRAFATKYLISTNRTIINRVPAPASPGAGKPGGAQ
jgi:predicted Zn-dependent peptidase